MFLTEILNFKILICLSRFDAFKKTFRLKLFGFYITENKKTQSKKFVFKHKRSDSIRQLSKNILSIKSFLKVWLVITKGMITNCDANPTIGPTGRLKTSLIMWRSSCPPMLTVLTIIIEIIMMVKMSFSVRSARTALMGKVVEEAFNILTKVPFLW